MVNSFGIVPQKRGPARRACGRGLPARIQAATRNIPAKVLAKAAKCSVRTAENAKQGVTTLSTEYFLNAAKDIPELKALAMEALGLDPVNADRERALAMLVNSYIRRGE